MLYLIDYESSLWCGGQSRCVVEARNEVDAEDKASRFMEESMRDLFRDEYNDAEADGEDIDDQAYTVNSVEPFDESHECWKYYIDETQSQFFPFVE